MSKKHGYKANIKGIEWHFYLQSSAAYIRQHGKDSEAITYTHEREVYFDKSLLNPVGVRHELLHVFVSSSNTSSSGLKPDQVEELCAEIFAEHGIAMIELADNIINFFLKKDIK